MSLKDKAAKAAYRKAWYEANKDNMKAYAKAWRESNKDNVKAYAKAYREANKDKISATNKAWRELNKGKKAAQERKRITGWTQEEYDDKLAEQGGRCAICGVEACSTGKAFAADHCHTTGKRRGILCRKCNTSIGMLGDTSEGLRRAFAYLLQYEIETNTRTNNECTIHESTTDHKADLQPTTGNRWLRDLAADRRPSHPTSTLALGASHRKGSHV